MTNGVSIKQSDYPVRETINRLIIFLQLQGATVYARIDQQLEAKRCGYAILPFEYILFGHPEAVAPVIRQNPVAALDLPLKIVAWEDEQKRSWIAYHDVAFIRERYRLSIDSTTLLELDDLLSEALANHE